MTIGHFDLPMQWESETWAAEARPVYEWLTGRPSSVATPEAVGVQPPAAEGSSAAAAEDITMEPMVITIPAARREALLRQAGWVKVNIQFIVVAFDNTPMELHTCYLQYQGPRGEASSSARAELRIGGGGVASFGDFWLKPQGALRFLATPDVASEALLDGSVPVPATIRDGYLVYNAVQDHHDIQIRASSQQAVADQMQAQGSVKFSILGFAELGGGGGYSTTTTQTTARELLWTVRVAANSITITQAAR
jgi:hypothetical protein